MESRDSIPNEADPKRHEKANQKENRPLYPSHWVYTVFCAVFIYPLSLNTYL